ncbi:MAG TPA: DUF3592 domain-containing protein [Hyphomicrobiaceae bacterium]|nr:DUF3592 domain-containing protein [Hyphomicrobiaceae bacterium]
MFRNALDTKSPLELILMGFGWFLIVIALLGYAAAAAFVLSSNAADGHVVSFQISPKAARAGTNAPADAARAPVVEFMADDGKPTRIVGEFYERDPSYVVGQIVPVRYRSSAPESGVIDVFSEKWAFPLAIGGMGLFFLLISRLFRRIGRTPGSGKGMAQPA